MYLYLCIVYYNYWNKGTVAFATSSSSFGLVRSCQTYWVHIKVGPWQLRGQVVGGQGMWNWIFVNLWEHQSSVTCFLQMFLKTEEAVLNTLFSCWANSIKMRGKDCEIEIFCLILPNIGINNLYAVRCRKCFLVRVRDSLSKPQTAGRGTYGDHSGLV